MSKKISTLAVGAKVRDPLSKYYGVPVGFQIADKNHAGYPANSTTLAAEKILCLKAFDAKESGGNSDRQNYGNNRYSLATSFISYSLYIFSYYWHYYTSFF